MFFIFALLIAIIILLVVGYVQAKQRLASIRASLTKNEDAYECVSAGMVDLGKRIDAVAKLVPNMQLVLSERHAQELEEKVEWAAAEVSKRLQNDVKALAPPKRVRSSGASAKTAEKK